MKMFVIFNSTKPASEAMKVLLAETFIASRIFARIHKAKTNPPAPIRGDKTGLVGLNFFVIYFP
jgi:hypothetical protein